MKCETNEMLFNCKIIGVVKPCTAGFVLVFSVIRKFRAGGYITTKPSPIFRTIQPLSSFHPKLASHLRLVSFFYLGFPKSHFLGSYPVCASSARPPPSIPKIPSWRVSPLSPSDSSEPLHALLSQVHPSVRLLTSSSRINHLNIFTPLQTYPAAHAFDSLT